MAEACLVDEIGPAELEGRGLWPFLETLLSGPSPPVLLLVVRRSLLERFARRADIREAACFDIRDGGIPGSWVDALFGRIQAEKQGKHEEHLP